MSSKSVEMYERLTGRKASPDLYLPKGARRLRRWRKQSSLGRLLHIEETTDQRELRELKRNVVLCLCVAALAAAFIGLGAVLR